MDFNFGQDNDPVKILGEEQRVHILSISVASVEETGGTTTESERSMEKLEEMLTGGCQ